MNLPLKDDLLKKKDKILVAVSGGKDSMALCHALRTQRPDLHLIVVHFDHALRPESSKDALWLKRKIEEWDLEIEIERGLPPKKGNLEDWGRKTRYAFFEKMRKKHQAEWICTAHHQDDDFESFFLHFLRGTRVKGLSGMQEQRGHLYRPLLLIPQKTILAYLKHHKIPYRKDKSNEDLRLKRNFLRKKIIPFIEELEPKIREKWQSQKNYWLDLQKYLEEEAEQFLKTQKEKELNRSDYRKLAHPLRLTVLEKWFEKSTSERIGDQNTLERWDNALLHWEGKKKTEWGKEQFLRIYKETASLEFSKNLQA